MQIRDEKTRMGEKLENNEKRVKKYQDILTENKRKQKIIRRLRQVCITDVLPLRV